MKEVGISEFKAKCLAMVEEVRKTRKPLRITRHGKPVAEVVPPSPVRRENWLGCMRGSAQIVGDIISPVMDMNDFEAWRDDVEPRRKRR